MLIDNRHLTVEVDVGDARVHLDQAVADERIARELPPWVRKALAAWPRQPVHADDPPG